MLLKQSENSLIYSSVSGESIPFTIGDASVIIDIIRKKIYSYPLRTMVQEYLSNAKDACMEAGKDSSHIDVALPTQLNPEFLVRDYGTGMSDERVREVFVKYGVSTKRESKSQLGTFGIGAKSGWGYTDSFIVGSFFEGTYREYIADVGENKSGRLLLVKESDTTEPNGVLIKIPVAHKDINDFKTAYFRATSLWEKSPNLTNANALQNLDLLTFKLQNKVGIVSIYKSTRALPYGIYLNAGGIPFQISITEFLSEYSAKNKLYSFCSHKDLVVIIEADPFKMGISANREGFSNEKYAVHILDKATKQITDYVSDLFKNSTPDKYTSIFDPLGALNFFADEALKVLFKNKPYAFDIYGRLVFTRTYLSTVDTVNFNKSIRNGYSEFKEKDCLICLSRSKGERTEERTPKDHIKTPDRSLKTKKAFVNARNTLANLRLAHFKDILSPVIPSRIYVLFQDSLTDDEYKEVASVIGAKEYIEDAYSTRVVINSNKTKKEKEEKEEKENLEPEETAEEKEKHLPVRCFTYSNNGRRHCRSSGMVRETYSTNLYKILEDPQAVVFYGSDCDSSYFKVGKSIRIRNFNFVCPSAENEKKLDAMADPRILPMEEFSNYLKKDKEIEASVPIVKYMGGKSSFCGFITANYDKLKSNKFDFVKINDEVLKFKAWSSDYEYSTKNFFKEDGPCDSELKRFYEAYPLFEHIEWYSLTKKDTTKEIIDELNRLIT